MVPKKKIQNIPPQGNSCSHFCRCSVYTVPTTQMFEDIQMFCSVYFKKKNFQLARAFGLLTLPLLAHFHACHLLSRFLPPNLTLAHQTLNPKISLLPAGLIALDFLLLLLTRAFPFSITESTAAGYPWQEKKKGKKEPFLSF